jgi:phosphate transport system permease protein
MTDNTPNVLNHDLVTSRIKQSLTKRHRKEKIFRSFGLTAVIIGFFMVFFLLYDITSKALPAFHTHWVSVNVNFNEDWLGYNGQEDLSNLDYRSVLRKSIAADFPEVTGRRDKRQLYALYSINAEFRIREYLINNPSAIGKTVAVDVLLDDDADVYLKEDPNPGEPLIRIDEKEAQWLLKLQEQDKITKRFNIEFFQNGDSREPELAGVRGALTGTALTMMVTLILSFPLGVAAALYLEEFAPKNRWTDMIEVNINNLAAVPSIIFGLLGLAVIINVFGLPRSAPLVGGIVLSLMTLPTIIIASRASIKAVPPSIREAALGLGASKIQTAFGHVLPMAMPGILTGTIIGLAQALGETAPLLMIGMVAFIVDIPGAVTDPSTVMPVQIFLWADSPERGFLAKTSAAIVVLLGFLFVMNASAAYLRRRFEQS